MALELLILTPDHQTRRYELQGDSVLLGRAHSNDLSYPDDASLSRKHVRFTHDAQDWWVEDLGSKNGTLVNGVRIAAKQVLGPGDRLSVGHLLITLIDSEDGVENNVVFVGDGPKIAPNATVMTSLEGLLSAETTAAGTGTNKKTGAAVSGPANAFATPVVRALVRAGRELSGHRPLEELFPLILDLSISAVNAERGVVMILDGDKLTSRAVHGEGFRISTTIRDRVLKEKTSVLVRDLAQDEALRQQVSISEQQIHTMMAVPLQTEERVIGLIYVDSRSFVREFTPDDLNLLTVLANVAATRIEHTRLAVVERREQQRTRDLDQAAEIQQAILPAGPPDNRFVDAAGHNKSCRTVGGDYYDFFPYDDGRLGLVLGDVAGKGMSAAMLMSNLQARVQILAEDPEQLAKKVWRLDQAVAKNSPDNRFITLFFAVVDPDKQEMTYCNAGHNPPLLIRADGSVERLGVLGTVLGMLPEIGYDEKTCKFGPGDMLVVFSDGVTEAENPAGEEYGDEQLASWLTDNRTSCATDLVAGILSEIDRFTDGAPAGDDVTVLVARHRETPLSD
ncbi:MAG: SpoIIE family protein phosphatase [Acidobacteria bacterium]|nr:SpoIIE family protein phosphatase [Acidobacteriota bacterium]NIM62560.1 SpoIIE family protein phosphatase [Acidobacteriota bacterium]NIO58293.1 SpoIIE family protein phosphatase [Acidobacteriota bacterium]NIQ29349.1 SpoIIE family protein phosphatase [Acidobacteriota bacterium]NIQ83949.1 SpoIIE family protein phosphatase [Acidobacteriota bacterium]